MQRPRSSAGPIIGICIGCVLIVVIGVVVIGYLGYNKSKGMFSGLIEQTKTVPAFVSDIKSHSFDAAETLIEPSAQLTLTSGKLKQIEESVEKKLGPMTSYDATNLSPNSHGTKSTTPGQTNLTMRYEIPLTYKKGTGTAIIVFKSKDPFQISGKISEFKIEVDDAGASSGSSSSSSSTSTQ